MSEISKYPKIQTLFQRDMERKGCITSTYSKVEFANINFWGVTEKIDGTNIRIIYDHGDIEFRGRTDNAQIPAFLVKHLQDTYTKEWFEEAFEDPEFIMMFGEGFGNKIQKHGKLYIQDGCSFILFDIRIGHWWLARDAVETIANKMHIPIVPALGTLSIDQIIELVKSRPKSVVSAEPLTMEGIVARSEPLMLFRSGGPIMFKLKVRDYDQLERLR